MLHHTFGRKFSRPTNQRLRLFDGLIKSLIIHGHIATTKEKANSIRGEIDRLVSKVKKNKVSGSRAAIKMLNDKKLVSKFVQEIVPLMTTRPSGFTKTTPLKIRNSDSAKIVRLEWVVEIPAKTAKIVPVAVSTRTRGTKAELSPKVFKSPKKAKSSKNKVKSQKK